MKKVKLMIVAALAFTTFSMNAENTIEKLKDFNCHTPITNVKEVSICKGTEKVKNRTYITEIVNIKCSWYVRISVQYHGLKGTYEVDRSKLISPEWQVKYWYDWIKNNLNIENEN